MNKSTGLLLDGVAAAETPDKAGEVLVVSGCDISSLESGDGRLNWEHCGKKNKDGEVDKNYTPTHVVGRIVYAKKIFEASSCSNEREKKYWNDLKVPFVYIIGRLYDGAGHFGAQELAAQIRDQNANKEWLQARLSIEGQTMESEGNILKKTLARCVAITMAPANAAANTGLLEDPMAPKGFDKNPGKVGSNILDNIDMDKNEVEDRLNRRFGSGSIVSEIDEVVLEKAITAGMASSAPSQLVGSDALVKENLDSLDSKVHKLIKEYPNPVFDKKEFRAYLKNELKDIEDDDLNHWVDLAETMRLKKNELIKALESSMPSTNMPKNPFKQPKQEDPKKLQSKWHITSDGGLVVPDESGLSSVQLKFHIPNDEYYMSILYPHQYQIKGHNSEVDYKKKVHEPWEWMMANWMKLNDELENRNISKDIIKHAVLFTAVAPHFFVDSEEQGYQRFLEMMKEGLWDFSKQPMEEKVTQEWQTRAQKANQAPNEQQAERLSNYNALVEFVSGMVQKHGSNVAAIQRSIVDYKKVAGNNIGRIFSGYSVRLLRYMLGLIGGGNLLVPVEHMMVSMFGLDEGSEITKKLIRRIQSFSGEGILEQMDEFFFQHSPVIKYVIEKYPEHFKGKERQAIFPAFWLHWLMVPYYESLIGGGEVKEKHNHEDVKDHMARHNIHSVDNVNKSESNSNAVNAFLAHADLYGKKGELSGMLGYMAHCVPHLRASSINGNMGIDLAKMESLVVNLAKAVSSIKASKVKPITYNNQKVIPGKMTIPHTGQSYDIIGEDSNKFVVTPKADDYRKGGVSYVPKSDNGTKYSIDKFPVSLSSAGMVDSNIHADPELTQSPEQHQLMHGLDLTSFDTNNKTVMDTGKWLHTDKGPVHAKSKLSRQEGLFYNLASSIFGLGHYVPLTSVFRHPTGISIAISRGITGARNLGTFFQREKFRQIPVSRAAKSLLKMGNTDELDKMMAMDLALGHGDRNSGSVVLDKSNKLWLVDNGHILQKPSMPAYMHYFGEVSGKDISNEPVSNNFGKWMQSVSPSKMVKEMRYAKVPESKISSASKRLVGMQKLTSGAQMPTRKQLLDVAKKF